MTPAAIAHLVVRRRFRQFREPVHAPANASRRAEDVGGQELSYAEVKAIASGNPAVLTLAEADAELQRLGILRRNHLDEQYAARRAASDLPRAIAAQTEYLAELETDGAAVDTHASNPTIIDGRPCTQKDVAAALGEALDRRPWHAGQAARVPVGTYRGLAFGLVVRPGLSPDVYLQGRTTRHAMLSREHPGPRAVLNALDRLAEEYGPEQNRVRRDVAMAEAQLRDHQARLGRPFALETYLAKLSSLRDRLRSGLTSGPPPPAGEPAASPSDLALQINTLRATAGGGTGPEALPRTGSRGTAGYAESVVPRIRCRSRKAEASSEGTSDNSGSGRDMVAAEPAEGIDANETRWVDVVRTAAEAGPPVSHRDQIVAGRTSSGGRRVGP